LIVFNVGRSVCLHCTWRLWQCVVLKCLLLSVRLSSVTAQITPVLIFTTLRTLGLTGNVISKECFNIVLLKYPFYCLWHINLMLLNTAFLHQLSGNYHNLLLHMILTFCKLCHSNNFKGCCFRYRLCLQLKVQKVQACSFGPIRQSSFLCVLVWWSSQKWPLFYFTRGRS
jgi:hypothetical protein